MVRPRLQIPERIHAIIETDNEEIITVIASLLRSISKSTNHPEIIQEFVGFALTIFEMNIYDSSLKILDFFEKYLKINSENSVLIFELCYTKLALYFENESVIDDILPIKISEIISKIKKLSPEINENFAKKISSSDTLQDTCACLLICSTVYKDNSCNEISISAILTFSEVLDFSVPFEYDQQLSAVILYSSFLSYCANLFEGKTIFEFFEKLVYFSEYDVSSALINLSKNKNIHEFITNDFVVTLASTRNESLLKCAAIFIEYLKDGQDEVLGTIIGLL